MLKNIINIKRKLNLGLYAILAKTLFLLLVLRLLFVFINATSLTKINPNYLLDAFIFGFRLDFIVAAYTVSFIYLIFSITKSRKSSTVQVGLFAIWATFISIINALYFKFLKEHISFDFFKQLEPDNNISLWTYLSEYWLMLMIGIIISVAFTLWVRIDLKRANKTHWLSLGLSIILLVFIARGGVRLKPLRTNDIRQYVQNDAYVVGFNSSLYIFETWANPITQPGFIETTKATLSPSDYSDDSTITPNFVIIILEGFGKEYTGLNRGMTHTYTPFLNSLIPKSICCDNAYANGLKSVDAVPAIFTGIPKLSGTAFIHSPHSSESRASIFNLLETLGYSSSFFHGTNNQSMGFQSFLKSNGLKTYYGLQEYPNIERDYDGHWGIYDGPYLDYVKSKLAEEPQPFVSGVFTLSSHHPYSIPVALKDSFKKGDIPIHKSLQYADYALKLFIESSENEAWFDNTIFIITADHSAENLLHAYRTPSGKYEVPLLLYSPKLLPPSSISKTVSHIDILPSILDLVNYRDPVVTLGHSIFDIKHASPACHFDNNIYHITNNHWSYGIANDAAIFLYNKKQDINCLNNIVNSNPEQSQELDKLLKVEVSKYFMLIK